MNKKLIIGAVVLLLLGGGVWYFLNGQNTSSSQNASSNAITSIKDAMSKSVSLECIYKDAEGRSSKSYIKNGAVRVDVVNESEPDKSAYIIMKDKKMYTWTAKKEGFVMELPDEEEMKQAADSMPKGTSDGTAQQQNVMADLEKYKDACKPAVVSDSLFTPPADVTFTDLSQMMKPATGTGSSAAPSMDPEKMQELMQKYQQNEN